MSKDKLPTGVTNQKAWGEYLKVKSDPLLNPENTVLETSDPHVSVNLKTITYALKKKIAHLPIDEQSDILEKHTVVRKLITKYCLLKKQAHGIKPGISRLSDANVLDAKTAELIEYFGRFHSISEVHKIVIEDWGYDVNYATVEAFRKRHLDKIKERQEEYKRDYSDLKLAHKRSRLDELCYLYNDRKDKYLITRSREDYKLLLITIEQIKKEVEGDHLQISVNGEINFNADVAIATHIQQELIKSLALNDIIVARVAARQRVDPLILVSRLHNSYYSKLAGFLNQSEDTTDEIIYPSKLIMSFDDMEKKNKELIQKEALIKIEQKSLSESEVKDSAMIKAEMLERIKKKRETLNESVDRIDHDKPVVLPIETPAGKKRTKKK